MREPAALSGISVIDATESIAGQVATRLMADYGADVTLVEPPGGSRFRGHGPFDRDRRRSLLFRHLNAGKHAVVSPDLARTAGGDHLTALVLAHDVAVVSDPSLADGLRSAAPDLVVGVVTDFGADGPYAAWTGGELVHQALSGSMYMNGLPGREPLYGVGHRSSHAAGAFLYIGLLAALYEQRVTGANVSPVDVTVHESAVAMEQNFATQWAYSRTYPVRGEAERSRARGRARCRDGWVIYFVRPGQWAGACAAFGAPELADDPRFASFKDLVRNWADATRLLEERARDVDVDVVLSEGMAHGLALAPVCDAARLLADPQLAARDFWQHSTAAPGEEEWALGPLFRPARTPAIRNRSAPEPPLSQAMGEPNRTDRPEVTSPGAERQPLGPLSGVNVVDFTTAWAGPMATRILAHLGANVIKVEGPNRPDDWRGDLEDPAVLEWYPDAEPGTRPYDRHAFFNTQNNDKQSVVLDLKDDRGVAVANRLAARADVVTANFSPGTMERLGLGYADLRVHNARLIMLEMSAAGRDGPRASQRGLGPTMEAMAGMSGHIGYPDHGPVGSGTAYLDPAGGLHGAAAVLTALVHRQRTGEGQYVEVAQQEAAMHWIGELLLDSIENGVVHGPVGNRRAGACPHGAFPARGDDEWVAIAVFDDAQWAVLAEVVGQDGVDLPAGVLAAGARERHREAIEDVLSGWTATRDKTVVASRLQAAGVPAAPVVNGRDLHDDPHLRARGWYTSLDHPAAGTHDYPGLPLSFAGARRSPLRPAPTFGRDSRAVLHDLGLSVAEVDALLAAGVTSEVPTGRVLGRTARDLSAD